MAPWVRKKRQQEPQRDRTDPEPDPPTEGASDGTSTGEPGGSAEDLLASGVIPPCVPETHVLPSSSGGATGPIEEPPGLDPIPEIIASAPVVRRPPKKPRRHKDEVGMPPDDHLIRLATVYLTKQCALWPELVKAGVLRPATDALVRQMAEEFKTRQLSDELWPLPQNPPAWIRDLYDAYLRYSDESSNPCTIDDQLAKILPVARDKGHFIPWSCVHADVELSGLNWGRRGYKCVNLRLKSEKHKALRGVYLYDFSRGGRDPQEWFRFAGRCKQAGKHVFGAADGFDLNSQHGNMMLHVHAMHQDYFVSLLRTKVRDGLNGAAGRNTSTGRPGVGYGLIPKVVNGSAVTGGKGVPLNELAIHWPTMRWVVWAWRQRGERRRSKFYLAKVFNRHRVDGRASWNPSDFGQMFDRPTYMGVRVQNRTRQGRNPETNAIEIKRNPHGQWQRTLVPHLRVISDQLWKKVRRLEYAEKQRDPRTGKRPSRNERSATTPWSSVLRCGHCRPHGRHKEITLCQSGGKRGYQSMGCTNGQAGKHGCRLTASKTIRDINECLLEHIKGRLLPPDAVRGLVARANGFLAEEAAREPVDLSGMRERVRELERERKSFVRALAGDANDPLLVSIKDEIRKLETEITELKGDIGKAQLQNAREYKPIVLEDVERAIANLDKLMCEAPAAAAAVLKRLLGEVLITQEKVPGRPRGAKWIATFRPNVSALLADIAGRKDESAVAALERSAGADVAPAVGLVIDHVPKHVKLARNPHFSRLREAAASISEIHRKMKVPRELIRNTIVFVETGVPPKTKPSGRKRKKAR